MWAGARRGLLLFAMVIAPAGFRAHGRGGEGVGILVGIAAAIWFRLRARLLLLGVSLHNLGSAADKAAEREAPCGWRGKFCSLRRKSRVWGGR